MRGSAKARPRLGSKSRRRRRNCEGSARKFLSDAEARNLSENTIRKFRLVTSELEEHFGAVAIRSVTVDDVRQIRESWDISPLTMQKRLQLLRSSFRLCRDSGWLDGH